MIDTNTSIEKSIDYLYEAKRSLQNLEKELDDWKQNAQYLLESYPGTIRVREGGGAEDLLSSLCVTFIKLRDEVTGRG
jgi:hypothetical protein